MSDIKRFYQESIETTWKLLQHNPNYYLDMESLSTYQKIDELYDVYVYYIEKEDYVACIAIKEQLDKLNQLYSMEREARWKT